MRDSADNGGETDNVQSSDVLDLKMYSIERASAEIGGEIDSDRA